VCELLHNASLIQDDLLDRTATRRGTPSVWIRYGDTTAVCAGDLMLSAAYCLLADLSSTALIASAIRLVHLRTSEVIFGQASESVEQAEDKNTEVYYERSARGKSASLLITYPRIVYSLIRVAESLCVGDGLAAAWKHVADQVLDRIGRIVEQD
jgi:geranylgeranyl pyrophosphate synthase